MKRILTMLAGVSLVAGLFAATPAPAKAIATGGWLETPDVVVAPRDRNVGPVGTCNNPDYTSINSAVASLDDSTGLDSYVLGVCKGTYIQRESITLFDSWMFVGQGASKSVIDGSQLEFYSTDNNGIIEDAYNDITVAHVTFKGGMADYGGAIYTYDDLGPVTGAGGSDFTCIASSFINNSATFEGGAVYSEGDILLNRCTFRNNTAGDAGGAIYGEQDIIDYGSTYTLNTADNGGAVAEGGIAPAVDNTIGFYGSTFTKNSALAGDGGAIYADNGDTFIEGSKFTGNFSSDEGGAVFKQGCTVPTEGGVGGPVGGVALLTYGKCTFEISSSAFSANTADFGGAIASLDISTGLTISGSTFQLNRAEAGAAVATYGFLESGSNQFIRNSAFTGVIAYMFDRKAMICGYSGPGLDPDSYDAYILALIDSAEEIDFSGNRFSRNLGGTSWRLMPYPESTSIPLTLVIVNTDCVL